MILKSRKEDFPQLKSLMNNKPLVYLDSAATTLKPQVVIDRITRFNSFEIANVHRGAYTLSDEATTLYEMARQSVSQFIGATHSHEIIFTRGTTESMNLVASTIGDVENFLLPGDEITLTEMEHHGNFVPWQMLAQRKNLKLKFIPIQEDGTLDLSQIESYIHSKTKILAITHASNHLGTINDIEVLIQRARQFQTCIVVDGAQAIGKFPVSVKNLDVDFYAFSGHKMFAPFGIGVLYGKESWLEKLPPYQFGGSMISKVTFDKTTFNTLPHKFEAGTPNVEGAIALHTAIDYINSLGWNWIESHQNNLKKVAFDELQKINHLKWVGSSQKNRTALFSFNLNGLHHSDVGHLLNMQGIAVRVGHHCTQPLLTKYNITGSIRASFSIYNDIQDLEILIQGLIKAQEMLT